MGHCARQQPNVRAAWLGRHQVKACICSERRDNKCRLRHWFRYQWRQTLQLQLITIVLRERKLPYWCQRGRIWRSRSGFWAGQPWRHARACTWAQIARWRWFFNGGGLRDRHGSSTIWWPATCQKVAGAALALAVDDVFIALLLSSAARKTSGPASLLAAHQRLFYSSDLAVSLSLFFIKSQNLLVCSVAHIAFMFRLVFSCKTFPLPNRPILAWISLGL